MNDDLLQKLKAWRQNMVNIEKVEPFRVFTNKTLENIAEIKPSNREELMAIKGIKDRKFAKYGEKILAIINNSEGDSELFNGSPNKQPDKPLSVSAYIDLLNQQLSKCSARIKGEISSVDTRDRVIYFSLKDSNDESIINCLIWKRDYNLSGIEFEVGMEVILEGTPDVYKPTGRLSFKTSLVELVGEGALKKAYDQLKKKLAAEGLLLKERKREIPNLPQRIGIITSRQGAVLADFLGNIGHYGFKIKMIDSRVEGQSAVTDLLSAIKTIKKKSIEVLVIMRGGGSLESLQPFNNESLIREIANFPVPVIAAIGHDKDVPLVSLVADLEVSTPSIAAITLSKSWKEAIMFLERHERSIFDNYRDNIKNTHDLISQSIEIIRESGESIIKKYKDIKNNFRVSIQIFKNTLLNIKNGLEDFWSKTLFGFNGLMKKECQQLEKSESIVSAHNPERQLNLGYSIASINGKIVKSIKNATAGNNMDLMVVDGTIISQIKNINNKLIK